MLESKKPVRDRGGLYTIGIDSINLYNIGNQLCLFYDVSRETFSESSDQLIRRNLRFAQNYRNVSETPSGRSQKLTGSSDQLIRRNLRFAQN